MTRRGWSEAQRRVAAMQGCRQMISRGERPVFRPRPAPDGSWSIDEMPGLSLPAMPIQKALDAIRREVAELLEVPPDAFDVER